MFFEDLNCPIWSRSSRTRLADLQRAGYTVTGRPPISRAAHDAQQHGPAHRAAAAEAVRARASGGGARGGAKPRRRARGARSPTGSRKELERIERRSKITYIDPIDVRYRRFDRVPQAEHRSRHVLPDGRVGLDDRGDEGPREAVLHAAARVPVRRYRHVDIVFIRHTSTAEEVDEETFFYSRETGGTVVSTALEKMLEIARARYPTDRWNIYGAQASDGDNYGADSGRCVTLLGERHPAAVPVLRLYRGRRTASASTGGRATAIWRGYSEVAPRTRISRCGGSATRRRSSRCSTNCLQKGRAVRDGAIMATRAAAAQARNCARCSRARTGTSS